MRLRKRLFVVGILLVTAGRAWGWCESLADQLREDEPRVKAYVLALSPGSPPLAGITLCDGSVLFRNWVLIGRVSGLDPTQFVFLFKDGSKLRAVAWVGPGGQPLPIPECRTVSTCGPEPSGPSVISGDVYTWKAVRPGEEVVIVWYPPDSWASA